MPVLRNLDQEPPDSAATSDEELFLESLMDNDLYSMGAYFCDQHPQLIEEVIARSTEIEAAGLAEFAGREGLSLDESFRTLLTGLAVRYYKAVAP